MDPLSLTVSALTLGQVALGIIKVVRLVQDFRDIPSDFKELLRSLQGLEELVLLVEQILLHHEPPTMLSDSGILINSDKIIDRLKNDLLRVVHDTETLCSRVEKPSSKARDKKQACDARKVVSKRSWLREDHAVKKLKSQILSVHAELSAIVSTLIMART